MNLLEMIIFTFLILFLIYLIRKLIFILFFNNSKEFRNKILTKFYRIKISRVGKLIVFLVKYAFQQREDSRSIIFTANFKFSSNINNEYFYTIMLTDKDNYEKNFNFRLYNKNILLISIKCIDDKIKYDKILFTKDYLIDIDNLSKEYELFIEEDGNIIIDNISWK